MDEIKPLWRAQELALRLGTTRRTINTLRWQIHRGLVGKDRLPPPLAIGGRPRWDPDQVEAWLRANGTTSQQSQSVMLKSKTGRKRLSTQPPIRLQ